MARVGVASGVGVGLNSPRGESVLGLLNPLAFAADVWAKRDLIRQFTIRESKTRHRGTHLGAMWNVLTPLIMVSVYTLVFSTILRARLSGRNEETSLQFATFMLAGLMTFSIFAEPLGRSAGLVANRVNFVKRMVFPVEIFAITSVLVTLMHACMGIGVVMLLNLITGGQFSWTIALYPIVVLPAVLVAISVGWVVSALGVYIPDLQQIMGPLVQRMLFFLTPIFYTLERVPEDLRWILYLNPMTPVVEGARKTLLMGQMPDWTLWGAWMVAAAISMPFAYAMFMRWRRGFADVL
ncbi:MAG: ABC transporter permease [Phycisphaeraceae bacterium]|nr:ABC transporter permease [Phycisphaeraceae bacterium]